ncbi:MAG TPA: serine hydrolase domain-containing protein [Kofleriaceae bacterium]|nr:serine hydrolase domain-containing protein [Kofleriaceae bacterium]
MDVIAGLLDDALAAGLGSAAAVSVGDGGVEVFRHAAGTVRRLPDRGPAIDAHTAFDLASLTKPIATVALAMVLAGEGRLELAAPIRRWLPDAASAGTVRDLLGHSAGCAAHVEIFRHLRAARPADPYGELIARAAREPCDPPGATAVYSDLGFIQLGAIVERAAGEALPEAFARRIAGPLGLRARYAPEPVAGAVATELDERGLVCGLVHDENAYYGGRACGHAGLFGSIGDVARFAAAIVAAANGVPGALPPGVVARFLADAPIAGASWRLGWDTPSPIPGVSQAGDRWPRAHAVGHTGFTGTSLWLDLPRRRWVALLANRVHPTRHAGTADAIKVLRRAVNDAALAALQ